VVAADEFIHLAMVKFQTKCLAQFVAGKTPDLFGDLQRKENSFGLFLVHIPLEIRQLSLELCDGGIERGESVCGIDDLDDPSDLNLGEFAPRDAAVSHGDA
jgi:hypothetical protein